MLGTGGDAFYFPLIEDEEISAAQEELASVMISPETQVAFNLKKGSLPVRGDVDLAAANDCMKKGLEILAAGNTVPGTDQLITPDTNTQLEDLMSEFFSDMSLTPEDAQARCAEIIAERRLTALADRAGPHRAGARSSTHAEGGAAWQRRRVRVSCSRT